MTGIVVLAAGGSTRLGKPKQLLIYKERPLIMIAVEAAVCTGCYPVVVVAGAFEQEVTGLLSEKPVFVVTNERWKEGMASSIKIGLSKILELAPAVQQVIIMLCDQPLVNEQFLNHLIDVKEHTEKSIVCAFYNNTAGVPVLFDNKYFNQLLSLEGQEGARKLLIKYDKDVATVPFEAGAVDIDTPDDYDFLQKIG